MQTRSFTNQRVARPLNCIGSKAYTIIFFSEVKVEGRTVMMTSVKNIWEPYEIPRQLNHTQKKFNEPNQSGIIQTQNGDWYFLTYHVSGDWSGCNMSLLPINWVNGWPILVKVGADDIGLMVWRAKKPFDSNKINVPQSSDGFSKEKLNQQWEWSHQPRADKYSLTERKGWLRLYAFKPLEENNLLKAGNKLTQRSMQTKKTK